MFKKKLVLATVLSMTMPIAAFASDATETMASIILKLNHQPSAAEKKDLQNIVDNRGVTENERRIASSMINMDHMVRQEDKPKLRAVLVDIGASEQERELAKILYQLEHHASDEDKSRLSKLTKAGDAALSNTATKQTPAAQKKPAPKTTNKPANKPQ